MVLPYYFAHHPLCSNYRKEVIQVGTWYLCRGCFFVFLSMIVSLLVTFILNPFRNLNLFEGVILVIFITCPAWVALFLSTNNRRLKDIFRISLGLGWGISLAEILNRPNLLEKFTIIGAIILVYFLFKFLKSRQNLRQKDLICSKCSERNNNYCSGYKKQLEIERIFTQDLSNYLQSSLSWDDIKKTID
ncbi:MAG: hypothetical protein ACTSPG_06925 [Candidatus Hodarchaeales archaeon]